MYISLLALLIVAANPLHQLESLYREARYSRDQLDVAGYRGVSAEALRSKYDALLRRFSESSAAFPGADGLEDEDRRALSLMRETVHAWGVQSAEEPRGEVECHYDPDVVGQGERGLERLTSRVYECFGRAALNVAYRGESLDRLTVLGLLARTESAGRRRGLFRTLEPVWNSVHGDSGAGSAYRRLVRLRTARWGPGESPLEVKSRQFGVAPATMEQWLVDVLEGWRRNFGGEPVEPWDYYYAAGRASRRLSPGIPLRRLRPINDAFFASLGAEPAALGIRYDLEPRPGKDPVAFTTFGARTFVKDGSWREGEFWAFSNYRTGGLDNLIELLHETGHGLHIAGIRTRPAFNDWPDSDTFTEALADMVAWEAYEPEWQKRYLGRSVPLRESLKAKYSAVMLDIAWALMEVRVHRDTALEPNQVWTDITGRYLGIRPHPEIAWWAMRGQLVNAPGYMLNYAIGALVAAELRARVQELQRGSSFANGDATWYPWLIQRLYRFGLQKTSQSVLEEFLAHELSPAPLLADLSRAGGQQP